MARKKGIELSMNFFVVTVLSVVIFGFGMKLLYDMWKATDKVMPSGGCTDTELDGLLANNRVSVCPSEAKIARGKTGGFKIGFLNTESGAKFRVAVKASSGVKRNGDAVDSSTLDGFAFTYIRTYDSVLQNADKKIPLEIKVPSNAPAGKYAINVKVCSNPSAVPDETPCNTDPTLLYGIQKFYVIVP